MEMKEIFSYLKLIRNDEFKDSLISFLDALKSVIIILNKFK